MRDCEFLAKCPYFNDQMGEQRGLAELYKIRLCRKEPGECARYRVRNRLGKEAVPEDLRPNDTERAIKIMAAAVGD